MKFLDLRHALEICRCDLSLFIQAMKQFRLHLQLAKNQYMVAVAVCRVYAATLPRMSVYALMHKQVCVSSGGLRVGGPEAGGKGTLLMTPSFSINRYKTI